MVRYNNSKTTTFQTSITNTYTFNIWLRVGDFLFFLLHLCTNFTFYFNFYLFFKSQVIVNAAFLFWDLLVLKSQNPLYLIS